MESNRRLIQPQLFSSVSASIGGFIVGCVLGYASPATDQLRAATPPAPLLNSSQLLNHTLNSSDLFVAKSATTIYGTPIALDIMQISWFSSIFSIGALVGGLISSHFLRRFGRRGTMLLDAAIALVGWLLIGLGANYAMIMMGRLLTGVYTGVACVSILTYIGETSHANIRGVMATLFQLMLGFGCVYSIALGGFLSWYMLALACALIPVLFGVLMLLNVESPAYLMGRGKDEEAKEALQKLRGPKVNVTNEFEVAKSQQTRSADNDWAWSHWGKYSVYMPVSIVVLLMMAQQACGINAVFFNLTYIFKEAGSSISEYWSTVLVALAQGVCTIPAMFLIEKAGRKMLLIASSLLASVSFGGIGLFFYLREQDAEWTLQNLGWLPLFSVMLFTAAFSLGLGPIPFVMMGEMFAPEYRETASGLATAANWSTSFLVVFSFGPLNELLPTYGFYWLFGVICLAMSVLWVFLVKETKGKTLEEITQMFTHEQKYPQFS